jgi:hypothetical protein
MSPICDPTVVENSALASAVLRAWRLKVMFSFWMKSGERIFKGSCSRTWLVRMCITSGPSSVRTLAEYFPRSSYIACQAGQSTVKRSSLAPKVGWVQGDRFTLKAWWRFSESPESPLIRSIYGGPPPWKSVDLTHLEYRYICEDGFPTYLHSFALTC